MVFTDSEETWQRLDYSLFMNSPISLYWKKEIWRTDLNWFEENNYRVIFMDAAKWKTEKDFHSEIKNLLEFPDHYGGNLDALNDCLSDIEFGEFDGIVIGLENYDEWHKKDKDCAEMILDIMADCSYHHLLFGNRLAVLVQSNDPQIEFKPVGQRPVVWNPKEWLNKNRGL
ncbi:MAG TPA: barnase inhibitor [Chloroflexi bacterium]|nr:barnase inhibitor [Chloroflexota bacterium]